MVYEFEFFYIIKVFDKKPGKLVELLRWDGLRWETRIKWDWYFKYRAALLQVKYPKYIVKVYFGQAPPSENTIEFQKQNKLRAKKAKLTKIKNNFSLYQNEFDKFKSEFSELFPIEESLIFKEYQSNFEKFKEKINQLQFEINNL